MTDWSHIRQIYELASGRTFGEYGQFGLHMMKLVDELSKLNWDGITAYIEVYNLCFSIDSSGRRCLEVAWTEGMYAVSINNFVETERVSDSEIVAAITNHLAAVKKDSPITL